MEVQRQRFGTVYHVPCTIQSGDIGDLVQVGDDRRDAAGHHRLRIAGDMQHGALRVDMPVDEAGYQIFAPDVDDSIGVPVIADAGHYALADSDIPFLDIAAEGVHDFGMCQDQIGRGVPLRHRYQTFDIDHSHLILNYTYVGQIPESLVAIQAVPHHESVRYLYSQVIDGHIHFPPGGLIEQGAYAH